MKYSNVKVDKTITRADVDACLKILEDNGIDPDESECVLQALGYALLDAELFQCETENSGETL